MYGHEENGARRRQEGKTRKDTRPEAREEGLRAQAPGATRCRKGDRDARARRTT